MSTAVMTDHLPAANVQRILTVLMLISAPHFARLPLWASLLVIGICAWRWQAAQRTWAMPPRLLRSVLAIAGFAGVYAQFGTLNGHYAGVALLVLMLAMKLTEMTRRRDYLLVIYLSYFLLITHFLFSQEMLMLPVLFLGALAITMVLIDVNHPHSLLPARQTLRLSARLLLQALPLMLVFFVLFPRIPGPLWGFPSDAGAGVTGLSDSMEPGAISSLSQSDAVAFRVRFSGPAPPRRDLYWRGPVFEYFNGRAWLPGAWAEVPRPVTVSQQGPAIDYEIQMEPHGHKWVLPLDLPIGPWPADVAMGPDLVVRQRRNIIEKQLFQLRSILDYQADVKLPLSVRQRNLLLPALANPRTRALAQSWRDQLGDDRRIIQAALSLFRNEAFSYTLRPPRLLDDQPIDQFLFSTRAGFCEHYASSFAYLMRAADIPARVVTGYQGAEANGDYHIVRQFDAHAWTEVWLPGEGWVRVDPTAAVATERIELGLGGALPSGESLPALARMNRDALINLRLRWDQVNALWNRWVLAYGPELQQRFLGAIGLPGLRALLLSLTFGTVLLLLIIGIMVNRGHRALAQRDPILKEWQRFVRKLNKAGLQALPQEGPRDLSRRVSADRPEWASAVEPIARLYIRLRYASQKPDPQLFARLRQRVRRFPKLPNESPTSHPAAR